MRTLLQLLWFGAVSARENIESSSTSRYIDMNLTTSVTTPTADWKPPKGQELFHYPYRPKFLAHPVLLQCELKDFDYREEDRLGQGGFGQVFKAVHKPTGKTVAIKKISAVSIKERPKHVEYEETIQRAVIHPFISTLYCSLTNKAHDVFFVLEFFPGGNLTKQLSKFFPLPRNLFSKYVAQTLLALRYMHHNCIVYRDLKGENIMLDEFDNIKLIDFGLAVYDCQNKLTNLSGTLEYVAPEVAARSAYGRAADYYSLGVLVYLLQKRSLPYRHQKAKKSQFTKDLASGKLSVPPTNDPVVDDLISILTERDQQKRWENVYVNFDKLKKHPFFEGLDWDYHSEVVTKFY